MDLFDRAANFIPVLLSLTVHEWAHAWSAWKLGDDTARLQGRVSLNPLDHIDPVGTLLLPLLGVPFGWAKPVPVNPVRFSSGVSMPTGILITAAAGPISNILIAIAAATALYLLPEGNSGDLQAVDGLLRSFVLINVLLAVFNLIPVPPLDGSRIAESLMPTKLRPVWNQVTALGPILLLALVGLPLIGIYPLRLPVRWVLSGLSLIR